MSLSYRSNQIRLNYPNKVLGVSVSSIAGTEYWPFANGSGDLWYEGSPSKKYYRWEITFSVTAQNHGSHLTRDDFQYNGLDVQVGDWIAGATDGKCLKIISISAKTRTSVTCVVEDWLRYNTFAITTGNGIFGTGAAVVFTLNENGYPMLDPLPTSVTTSFYPTVMSRFQYLNPQVNYVLEKTNHGFVKGDVIAVTENGFVKANALTADRMVGVVTESGPGPNFFMVLPNNRIIDFDPNIPGSQGEYIYVDTNGTLTNVTTSTGKVAFLNIQSAEPTVLTGDKGNPQITDGYAISINGYSVTLSGASGNANVTEIVSLINTQTSNTQVVAEALPLENTIVSNEAEAVYGLVGGYTPFSAYFNTGSGNTLVNFNANGSVYATVSTPQDMAADITAANIANLVVSATATVLTLTELNGNAITITNGNAEGGGYFFVGPSNISGLPASTAATNASKIRLTRSNGGEILIYEDSTLWQDETGIFSGHTGSLPLAMNIEQGVRTGGTTVVANTSARDALQPAAGDQAYVVNKGDGEWGLYLYTGSAWEMLGNKDSSTVDAKTMTTTFTMPAAGFGNSTTQTLGNISPGRKIVSVSMEIHTAFSGYTGNVLPNIEVGTVSDQDLFVDDVSNDLTDSTVDFIVHPEYVYPASSSQDLQIRVRCNHYRATTGNVTVKLTYV
jgi:hypothetical protein